MSGMTSPELKVPIRLLWHVSGLGRSIAEADASLDVLSRLGAHRFLGKVSHRLGRLRLPGLLVHIALPFLLPAVLSARVYYQQPRCQRFRRCPNPLGSESLTGKGRRRQQRSIDSKWSMA